MRLFGFLSVYGLLIALAIAFAVFYMTKQEKRLGLPKDTAITLLLWIMPLALVGARAYYVAFTWDYYSLHPDEIYKVWHGGMAIYGGVITGVIVGWVYAKAKRLSFPILADMAAPALIMGQAIGRWGNFVNQECYGYEITDPAWQFFPAGVFVENTWYMATFFYESMWDLAGFCFLHFLRKKIAHPGDLILLYVVWYGVGRTVIEGLRTDSLYWGPVRVSQALSLIAVLICGTILIIRYLRKKA